MQFHRETERPHLSALCRHSLVTTYQTNGGGKVSARVSAFRLAMAGPSSLPGSSVVGTAAAAAAAAAVAASAALSISAELRS